MRKLTPGHFAAILFSVGGIIFSGAHVAFCAVEIKPSDQPEIVEERAREELQEQAKPKEKKEPVVPAPPEPALPAPPPGPRFFVSEISLRDNLLLSAAELEPVIAPFRSRDSSLADLQELAEKIQKEYRARGYFTTVAYLPPQSVSGGRVVIQVAEGRLGKVSVEGQHYFRAEQIRRLWHIEEGRVLRYQEVRQALRRLNDSSDREVQVLLRPGETLGTTDVILRVKDRFPVRPGLFADNQGTKSIGQERLGFSLRHSNLFGKDDSAVVGGVGGAHFGVGFAQYGWLFGEDRANRVTLSATHAQVSPKRQLKPFGVNGMSETYTAALSHSFLESEQAHLGVQVALDVSESRTKALSSTIRRDRLRVIRFAPEGRLNDAGGLSYVEPEFSFGLKGFGASSENNPVASRPGAPPDFIKARLNLTRIQKMPWETQGVLSITGQMATSKLASQEQLSMGGATSVRGYPEGDYLADQGVVARLEYLVPARWIPSGWRFPMLRLVGFIDRGYGHLRATTGTELSSRNPMGAGVGIEVKKLSDFTLRLEWGFNIGDRPVSDDSRSVFHFRVRQDF